jgi:hypothetical protein
METDDDLFRLLPTNRAEALAEAIGRRLVDVERFFQMDPSRFLTHTRFAAGQFFTHNSGPVQLCFACGVAIALVSWPEQLSLVVLPEPLSETGDDRLYRLSERGDVPPALADCLGRVCRDVRIWTLREEFEADEARQAAVSFLLEGGPELFYGTYLHGDLDSDYLLLGQEVPRDRVESRFSLARGDYITPE